MAGRRRASRYAWNVAAASSCKCCIGMQVRRTTREHSSNTASPIFAPSHSRRLNHTLSLNMVIGGREPIVLCEIVMIVLPFSFAIYIWRIIGGLCVAMVKDVGLSRLYY